MQVAVKKFYYVSHTRDTLVISAHILADGEYPILWNNKGLFGIISRQKVQNVIELVKDLQNLPQLNQKQSGLFHWDDCEVITARIAGMLLS